MPITDDIRRLEMAQLDMTAGLFTVLDNILSSIAPAPPVPVIKAGGHPEEIFVHLTDADKEEYECCICYMILKEAQQCKNRHKFCSSCIMAWTLTSTSLGADKCPLCRTEGEYKPCDILNARLSYKRVKCQKEDCDWTGFLKDFESHEHNKYNAPIKPREVKRSLPAIPGTIRGSDPVAARPGTIPRPTASRGAPTDNDARRTGASSTRPTSRSNPGHTSAGTNQARPTNRSQVSNTLRPSGTSNARTNQTGSSTATDTTGRSRPAPRPTPRAVRQSNRQTGTTTNANNTRRQTSVAPSGAAPANTEAPRRPNSVARATNGNATTATGQASGSQTSTSLPTTNQSEPETSSGQAAAAQTSTTETTATPRIQATLLIRRRPSTPNRITASLTESNTSTNTTTDTAAAANTSNTESEEVPPDHRPTRLPPISAARLGNDNGRTYRTTQFREMAQHIREGRSQLQDIMVILNGELETRRQNIARHQEFQERQHQERLRQLHEVHRLGQRLGEVASNLAFLMDGLRGGRTRGSQGANNDD